MADDICDWLAKEEADAEEWGGLGGARYYQKQFAAARTEIERLRAVLNAIDATHQSFTDPDTGMTFCDECNTIDLWPCRTHIFLYPEEARRG